MSNVGRVIGKIIGGSISSCKLLDEVYFEGISAIPRSRRDHIMLPHPYEQKLKSMFVRMKKKNCKLIF